jgi:hypothetical protein
MIKFDFVQRLKWYNYDPDKILQRSALDIPVQKGESNQLTYNRFKEILIKRAFSVAKFDPFGQPLTEFKRENVLHPLELDAKELLDHQFQNFNNFEKIEILGCMIKDFEMDMLSSQPYKIAQPPFIPIIQTDTSRTIRYYAIRNLLPILEKYRSKIPEAYGIIFRFDPAYREEIELVLMNSISPEDGAMLRRFASGKLGKNEVINFNDEQQVICYFLMYLVEFDILITANMVLQDAIIQSIHFNGSPANPKSIKKLFKDSYLKKEGLSLKEVCNRLYRSNKDIKDALRHLGFAKPDGKSN